MLPAAAGFAAALQSRAFADAMPRLEQLRSTLEHLLFGEGALGDRIVR